MRRARIGVRPYVLKLLASGPVSHERLLYETGEFYDPGRAYRTYLSQRGKRAECDAYDQVRRLLIGRRHLAYGVLSDLRRTGRIEFYNDDGVRYWRLTEPETST